MSLHVWILFVATFGPAVAFPGANAAFTVATALEQDAPRCLLAPAGFGLATALHAMLAITGASAILAASIELFQVLKWTAIVYLLWLGLRHWRRRTTLTALPQGARERGWRIGVRAMLVSLSNPQAILASALIFPLFLAADAPLLPQAAALVATAAAISVTVYSVYALAATAIKPWLLRPAAQRGLGKAIGSFYFLAAAGLALTRGRG
jgi:threonine/homoserine/homoserine lactone efflux protein